MADDKTYKPEEVIDQPFPNQGDQISQSVPGDTKKIYRPDSIPDRTLPPRVIAQELLSTSLNTQSRKILGEYGFTESGALQIGKYVEGKAGDLRITPTGIVARNSKGDNTFSIDGETGDATFRGTVQAADFVVADESGLVSLNNFTESESINSSLNQNITTDATLTDITGASISFSLKRDAIVLVFASVTAWLSFDVGDTGDGFVQFDVDGVYPGHRMLWENTDSSTRVTSTAGNHLVLNLSQGDHTVKLRAQLNITANTPVFTINSFRLSSVILGK